MWKIFTTFYSILYLASSLGFVYILKVKGDKLFFSSLGWIGFIWYVENDLYTAGGMDPLHFKCALLEEKKDLHFVIGCYP